LTTVAENSFPEDAGKSSQHQRKLAIFGKNLLSSPEGDVRVANALGRKALEFRAYVAMMYRQFNRRAPASAPEG
jgi:hypothetical protein